MPIVDRITIKDFPFEDKGITVREALKLIEDSDFKEKLNEVFDLLSIKDDFIEVPGASTLVKTVINLENRLKKIDVKAQLKDVRINGFTEENEAIFEIANIEDKELLKLFKNNSIDFETTYSVRADYFNQLYDMNKYLSFLLNKQYKDIVDSNLDLLEEKNKENEDVKVFRTVIDSDSKRYIRALTSTRYKDYNIAFSVFVTLIELHNLFKNKGVHFSISKFYLTDSEISVEFVNEKEYEFFDKSKICFSIVLSNDEIKRDAVKLKGLFSIKFDDVNAYLNPLNPNEGKTNILSFRHGIKVDNVKKELSNLNITINDFINDTLDDLKFVKKANNSTTINDIQDRLIQNAEKARDQNFIPLKDKVKKELLFKKVTTLFELLTLVDKVDEIFKDEYIQAQDYWRYKVYQALIKRGK